MRVSGVLARQAIRPPASTECLTAGSFLPVSLSSCPLECGDSGFEQGR